MYSIIIEYLHFSGCRCDVVSFGSDRAGSRAVYRTCEPQTGQHANTSAHHTQPETSRHEEGKDVNCEQGRNPGESLVDITKCDQHNDVRQNVQSDRGCIHEGTPPPTVIASAKLEESHEHGHWNAGQSQEHGQRKGGHGGIEIVAHVRIRHDSAEVRSNTGERNNATEHERADRPCAPRWRWYLSTPLT